MRRIAAETDGEENGKTIISVYNEALGAGVIHDKELDAPYEMGSVEKLG